MQITPAEWKQMFALRDELENPEDRALVRRLINYVEYLEKRIRTLRKQLREKEQGNG